MRLDGVATYGKRAFPSSGLMPTRQRPQPTADAFLKFGQVPMISLRAQLDAIR
jgi:hypothetical protein